MLTVFHYDWRRSNTVSAAKLADRICDVRKAAPKSPIYILAHSMGGLIANIWAAKYATVQCPVGEKPGVKEIAFVATPHLGAPKAIKAVTSGYNILFDELDDSIMQQFFLGWFERFERNHILSAINNAGMSFSSIYELLPIRSSEYCRLVKPNLSQVPDPVDSEDGTPLNMFDVETWKRYDLLRGKIEPNDARKVFYNTKLATLLRQAEKQLCDIVDFDPLTVVSHVDYVYGQEKADGTFGWFKLRVSPEDSPENSIEQSKIVQGDDTVPLYSAENYLVTGGQKTEVEADHLKLISSPAVLSMVDAWYANARRHAELDTAGLSPRYASLLSRENAATGKLIPVS